MTHDQDNTKTEAAGHTPGPWVYRSNEHDDWGFVRSMDGTLVAVAKDSSIPLAAHDEHWLGKTDPYEDNARLIAAAPEMLEALREALHFITDIDNSHKSVRQIRAAISKAEGQS